MTNDYKNVRIANSLGWRDVEITDMDIAVGYPPDSSTELQFVPDYYQEYEQCLILLGQILRNIAVTMTFNEGEWLLSAAHYKAQHTDFNNAVIDLYLQFKWRK